MKSIILALLLIFCISTNAFGFQIKSVFTEAWKAAKDMNYIEFAGGFVASVAFHELCHMAAYEIKDIDYKFFWLGFEKDRKDYQSRMAGPFGQLAMSSFLSYKYPKRSFTKGFWLATILPSVTPMVGDFTGRKAEYFLFTGIALSNLIFIEW